MSRDITINARWDGAANVWLATSDDVPGLVIEAETWPAIIQETRAVLPRSSRALGRAGRRTVADLSRGRAPRHRRRLMADLYRRLAAILRENGCKRVRSGKGSHEIWFSPINGRHLTVPRSTKSQHTANEA
jgi:predicted RNA binding protein YcfA (HicA-like mRNA interferase family)